MNDVYLKREFLATLDLSQYPKSGTPMVVGFIASIGSGKSYLAQGLSASLGFPVFDNDGIRRFLNAHGIAGSNPRPDLVIDIARTRRDRVLAQKVSYILDADLSLTYQLDREETARRGAQLVLVELDCPRELALSRIRQRRLLGNSASTADEELYARREAVRAKAIIDERDISFRFDCAAAFDGQLGQLIDKIRLAQLA